MAKQKADIDCPECMNALKIADRDYEVGDLIECEVCGSTLEVVKASDGVVDMVDLGEEDK